MVHTRMLALALVLTGTALSAAGREETTTWTGWFSDKGCAESKVKSGNIGPNGTECVKRCLKDGATPVFLSEQTKAMYEIRDHAKVMDDVGYYVELTGVVDEKAKTIAVRSVRHLSEVVQTCALPKRKSK